MVRKISLDKDVLLILRLQNNLRAWLVSLNGEFRSLQSPSYFGPRQDRWRALLVGCSKLEIKIFLASNE
jgi:hypothetical protein